MPNAPPLHTLAKVPSEGSLEDALADSLSGVQFIDTTFYAFTRRFPSGKVDKPRAVQANSRILKSSSTYFRGLLSGASYSTSSTNVLSGDSLSSSDTYEYESDSDLEDDDDIIGSLLATPSEISLKDDTEDKQRVTLPSESNSRTINASHVEDTLVIPMDSVAADTLEALIFYIYTGNIYFLPLRSRGTKLREEAKATHSMNHPNRPACSCKSIYRFAHEVGLEELKTRAEEYLFSQLDAENISDELFSHFSSRHPGILQRQTTRLLDSYWTPSTKVALGSNIQSIVRGEMPHAALALLLLLQRIPSTPSPLLSSSPPSPVEPTKSLFASRRPSLSSPAASDFGKPAGTTPTTTPQSSAFVSTKTEQDPGKSPLQAESGPKFGLSTSTHNSPKSGFASFSAGTQDGVRSSSSSAFSTKTQDDPAVGPRTEHSNDPFKAATPLGPGFKARVVEKSTPEDVSPWSFMRDRMRDIIAKAKLEHEADKLRHSDITSQPSKE